MKAKKSYWPMYLENLWNGSIDSYLYYKENGNFLLAEIYYKNADMVYNAQYLIFETLKRQKGE